MKYLEIEFPKSKALELENFKAIDYYTVENYSLPIELLMENAGLQLANLIAQNTNRNQTILLGIGNGNNGGGGLVAARRLLAWGYKVNLDLITEVTKDIPMLQLKRAKAFGAKISIPNKVDIWVDAYLGFSQRFPLPPQYLERIEMANSSSALKISLDIPTGFKETGEEQYFRCDKIITLAAPKKILYNLPKEVEIYVSDLGIPYEVYRKFNIENLPFENSNILKIIR